MLRFLKVAFVSTSLMSCLYACTVLAGNACSYDCKKISVYKKGGASGSCYFYSESNATTRQVSGGEGTTKRRSTGETVFLYFGSNCGSCSHTCNDATDTAKTYEASGSVGDTEDCSRNTVDKDECDKGA